MIPPATQLDQLDPATIADMVRCTIASLPVDPDASPEDIAAQREAALLALNALRPRDPIEAMLAARVISTHYAAMECLRRAALLDTSDSVALRLRGKAVSLANLSMRTLRELQKCQAAPPAYPVPDPHTSPATAGTSPRTRHTAPGS